MEEKEKVKKCEIVEEPIEEEMVDKEEQVEHPS